MTALQQFVYQAMTKPELRDELLSGDSEAAMQSLTHEERQAILALRKLLSRRPIVFTSGDPDPRPLPGWWRGLPISLEACS